MTENTRYEEWRAIQLHDPEVRAALEDLEHAYLVARLRIERGLTQEQLASLVNTKQASIARLEGGRVQPRLSFLRRVIRALGARLELRAIPDEEPQTIYTTGVSVETKSQDNLRRIPVTPINNYGPWATNNMATMQSERANL